MASLRESSAARTSWEDAADDPPDRDSQADERDRDCWAYSEEHMSALLRTIEGEIIPRLVVAHKTADALDSSSETVKRLPDSRDVAEFTRVVLQDDTSAASAYVKVLLADGVPLEAVFLELFAPTARRLGELWVADQCDFVQVTIGVGKLQHLLRQYTQSLQGHGLETAEGGRRALLAPTPGEQHTFGMLVVGEMLRRAGWDVTGEPASCSDDLCEMVHGEWFAVIGLSLSCEHRVSSLKRDIRALRRASRNGAIGVMVGGRVFVEHPELVPRVGADATAADGREAVVRAEELLKRDVSSG